MRKINSEQLKMLRKQEILPKGIEKLKMLK